jgi:hypothetical protein
MSPSPNEHAIFVDKNSDLSSEISQVAGDIQRGMTIESKTAKSAEESAAFVGKSYLRAISEAEYARILPIVEAISHHPKQFNESKWLRLTEPLRRCQEWINGAI